MERRQLGQRHAPGQGLADLAHERGRNRTQQQKAPVLLAPGVNGGPQPREDLRPSLGFIQHHQALARNQIFPGQVQPETLGGLLQVEILPGKSSRQRGLPALARADQGHGRELRQPLARPRPEIRRLTIPVK